MYKVYSKVLEENIMTFLEDNNILGESQGAFRRDRRIEDHLFTLNGISTLLLTVLYSSFNKRHTFPCTPFFQRR
jgi:hypothetical protein